MRMHSCGRAPCSRTAGRQQSSWSGRSRPCPWSRGSAGTPCSLRARAPRCALPPPGCSTSARTQPGQAHRLQEVIYSIQTPESTFLYCCVTTTRWQGTSNNDKALDGHLAYMSAGAAHLAVGVEAVGHELVAVELAAGLGLLAALAHLCPTKQALQHCLLAIRPQLYCALRRT